MHFESGYALKKQFLAKVGMAVGLEVPHACSSDSFE
jgi:hypothetical protein